MPFFHSFSSSIPLWYALVAVLWIISSDLLLYSLFSHDSQLLSTAQTYKGWFFIFITALMLFWLLKKKQNKIASQNKKLETQQQINIELFDNSPVSLWVLDFSQILPDLINLEFSNKNDFIDYFDRNPGAALLWGHRIRVLRVNNNTLSILKAPDSQHVFSNFKTIFTPDALSAVLASLASMKNGQTRGSLETSLKDLTGETLKTIISWSLYPGYEKDFSKVLLSVTDVTALKKSQDLLLNSEKMLTLASLSSGLVHEINNPLGVILQGIQNTRRRLSRELAPNLEAATNLGLDFDKLEQYLNERSIPKYLEGIEKAGERAAKIIQNMLSFSHQGPSLKTPVDLHVLIDNALELANNDYNLQQNYDFRHILVERHFAPHLPPCPCHPLEIEQALLNLFKNAAQAMYEHQSEKSPPRLLISTSLSPDSQNILMSIEDNGPGILPENQKHLFEPFFTTKPVGKGTGLGLSVAFFILTEKHRGTLSVSSQLGKGSIFTLTLPLEHATEEP